MIKNLPVRLSLRYHAESGGQLHVFNRAAKQGRNLQTLARRELMASSREPHRFGQRLRVVRLPGCRYGEDNHIPASSHVNM